MDHHKPAIVTMETLQLTMVQLTMVQSTKALLTVHWHLIHIGNQVAVTQTLIQIQLETTHSVGWGGINLTEFF
mgnify:CR=1 FL=1